MTDRVTGLLQFASKFSRGYVDNELQRSNSIFKDVDRERFLKERLILIFWLIDKFLADPARKLTAAIHERYFSLRGLMQNQEALRKESLWILSRYKEYYAAWDDKPNADQDILASMVAKNILGLDRPIWDAKITVEVSSDLLLLIKSLKDFEKELPAAI